MSKDTEQLIEYNNKTEKYLLKYNMREELLHLYSLMARHYTGIEQYSNAYVYIFKGEKIANQLYEKNKDLESLSTLIAIKYLKAVVALDIGMENEADIVFNEAEILRKTDFQIRERVDIYSNILLYYQDKKEYQLVEKYGYKVIELIEKIDPNLYKYKSDYARAYRILANNYIKIGEIDKCIDIINILKSSPNLMDSNKQRFEMYQLYANVYKYYGNSLEYINYLSLAYDEIKESKESIKKVKIVECMIEELESLDNQEELMKWYRVERDLIRELQDFMDTQYLLSQIIDTELQNANYNIEILYLQKSNMRYFIIFLWMIIGVILGLINFVYKSKKLLKKNIDILEQNMMIQHKYYENIKKQQENIKRIKHDIKNHMNVIRNLIIDGEYEHVNNYVQSINEQLNHDTPEQMTNHKILDAILFNKIKICKDKNIIFDLDVKIPEKIPIDDFDLCVIYGNLLDNAIEACLQIQEQNKEKYIELKTFTKGDYLFINIKNNFSLDINTIGNKFITHKEDKLNHGIGMDNIRTTIQKYDGQMKITYADKEFNVSILLKMNQ